jgi:branched-subunit amino acid transport protein
MSWTTLLLLAAGAYVFKAAGLILGRGWRPPTAVQGCLDLLPAALIAALIVVNTVIADRRIVFDARLPGVAVASIAAWRKAPFPVVVLLGAGVTALLRRAGWLG